ncbi:MAG TPA: DUF1501 domain-containing protein [Armatimonadota bacterium]|nr:DUF1501 domain-containing protein [Armatimonadota bacterium]
MNEWEELSRKVTRRTFLGRTAAGMGSLALASFLDPRVLTAASAAPAGHWSGVVHPLDYAPKAKRIIYLYMAGGPSHLETFDNKPKLAELNGQPMPASLTKGQQVAQLQGVKLNCFGPQQPFQKFGKSQQEISTIFPHLGGIADDICIVRSMHTDAINHDPAHTFMNTGTTISGRPAFGSWLWYGIGNISDNLPGFVVLTSLGKFGQAQPIASRQWSSGFIPSKFQGIEFHAQGDPVLYVTRPAGVTSGCQHDIVDAVNSLNELHDDVVDDPEISARISQYELAFRMQTSIPELTDLSKESPKTLAAYGATPGDGSFASNCLLARRLAERGVRFVQLYHRGWDHHGGIKANIKGAAGEVDQACAALVSDLKQRGMLEDTLVVWGGEFGRTPMAQGDGRDHHIKGFSIWMAGGGIKPGITYGATDDFGYNAEVNPVHVHDLHATILRLFGIEHTKLTYRFEGRDFRLTDVAGNAVTDIIV